MRLRRYRFLSAMTAVLFLSLALSLSAWAATSQHIKIVLNSQSGAGGTSEIYVEQGGTLPLIRPPARRGYSFQGYYSAASGIGEQYYDAAGNALKINDFSDSAALYAHWSIKTYSISYENMEGATFGANAPTTYTYGKNVGISDPVKENYQFYGWRINGNAIASKSLTLGATVYDEDLVLTAVWNKAALVTVVDNATETVTVPVDDLKQVFQRQVDDPSTGVTADDLNSEEVLLRLTASNADHLSEGASDILEIAQGEVLKFYDFSVDKFVTKAGAAAVKTPLLQIPNTVRVEITLSEALRGRSSYRVYRYHAGRAEPIPSGPVVDSERLKESFELSGDGTTLILNTRKLSTYAVIGGEKELGGAGTMGPDTAGLDVQAQVRGDGDGPVYMVELKWGKMQFTYSTGREWDPDEHRYTDVRIYDWIPSSCYTNGNNRIEVYNHSNADVSVGFEVSPVMKEGADSSLLDGVDMVISGENKADAPPAQDILLPKVPSEHADAPVIFTYLRLNGSPTDPEFYKGLSTDEHGYVKVARIAVTIAHLDGPRTPKSHS